MTIKTSQELKHAEGVVERRRNIANNVGDSTTKKEALYRHGELSGAVREVRKHLNNILMEVDNEGAGHALSAQELLAETLGWVDNSRLALSDWGFTESEISSIEKGAGI